MNSRRSRSSRKIFQSSAASVGHDEKIQKTTDLEYGDGEGGGGGDAGPSSTESNPQSGSEDERTMGLVSAILMVRTGFD